VVFGVLFGDAVGFELAVLVLEVGLTALVLELDGDEGEVAGEEALEPGADGAEGDLVCVAATFEGGEEGGEVAGELVGEGKVDGAPVVFPALDGIDALEFALEAGLGIDFEEEAGLALEWDEEEIVEQFAGAESARVEQGMEMAEAGGGLGSAGGDLVPPRHADGADGHVFGEFLEVLEEVALGGGPVAAAMGEEGGPFVHPLEGLAEVGEVKGDGVEVEVGRGLGFAVAIPGLLGDLEEAGVAAGELFRDLLDAADAELEGQNGITAFHYTGLVESDVAGTAENGGVGLLYFVILVCSQREGLGGAIGEGDF